MTAPDIVTALRGAIDNPGTSGQVLLSPELATELVAEVERLRAALDQRTDPELDGELPEAFCVVLDELIVLKPDGPFDREQVARSIVATLQVNGLLVGGADRKLGADRCGHACCDDRDDPLHDHFLSPDDCPRCDHAARLLGGDR